MLAQTNFGGNLTIAGVPIFRSLQPPRRPRGPACRGDHDGDGSCMLVVATDAPLDARDLRRLAARADLRPRAHRILLQQRQRRLRDRLFDVARDARAASTRPRRARTRILPTDATSPLFEAALEATEEAVYNSLFQATTVRSAIGTAEAIPIDRVRELLKR